MTAELIRRLPRAVAALLAAVLAVAALAPLANARETVERYDGRELVRGLLLGSGPVAEQLPEVFGELPKMPEEAQEIERLLLSRLDEQNPELFDSIAKRVDSGDHVLVEEALNDGSKAILELVSSGFADELELSPVPYHWHWLPFRWHFLWDPFRWIIWWNWTHYYNYDYQYDFDYDGTLGYRYFVRWDTNVPDFERYKLDAESQLANERFVDLVVERLAR